jgi:hypothetical protein
MAMPGLGRGHGRGERNRRSDREGGENLLEHFGLLIDPR